MEDRKALRKQLAAVMHEAKGKAVSDLDAAYRRGWRDCVRRMREMLADVPTGGRE